MEEVNWRVSTLRPTCMVDINGLLCGIIVTTIKGL